MKYLAISLALAGIIITITAKAEEVCDSSIARGGWTVIAPHLGSACEGVMVPLTDDLAIVALECSDQKGRATPTGAAHVGQNADGLGCRMTLDLQSYYSAAPADPGAPYTYWYCSWCTEGFVNRVGSDDPQTACEAMGLNLAAKYSDANDWTLIATSVVGGTPGMVLYGPGSEVVIQDALCKWRFDDGSVSNPFRDMQHTTSGVCLADGVGTLAAENCWGEEAAEWEEEVVDIQAYIPVDEVGDVFTDDAPSVIRKGEATIGTPVTIIRRNPRTIHPDPAAGASGGVMN